MDWALFWTAIAAVGALILGFVNLVLRFLDRRREQQLRGLPIKRHLENVFIDLSEAMFSVSIPTLCSVRVDRIEEFIDSTEFQTLDDNEKDLVRSCLRLVERIRDHVRSRTVTVDEQKKDTAVDASSLLVEDELFPDDFWRTLGHLCNLMRRKDLRDPREPDSSLHWRMMLHEMGREGQLTVYTPKGKVEFSSSDLHLE